VKTLALLVALALARGENRLWFVDVELEGPGAELVLDCGADGATRVPGPFLAGEHRSLCVPVPARSPLGVEALGSVPLPSVELRGDPGGAGSAHVRGWSAEQPGAELERRVGALLTRPRPPAPGAHAGPSAAELLILFVAGVLALRWRRRLVPCVLVGLGAGALGFALARRDAGERAVVLVQELDLGSGLALEVRVARDELALARTERLEVVPAGHALLLEARAGAWRARARGAELQSLSAVNGPAAERLDPARNGWRDLARAWTRDAAGVWRARGAWNVGAALETGEPGAGAPGWLASALPPGRGVLVGRLAEAEEGVSAAWVRCVGFEAEDGEGADGD